ncbi:MAG: flagellar basal body L-ring protein FlgH [Nitrospirae bacterium]|nr:flagellar basal body L-ring protein FlgH [Nitrospirota bacterium]
MKNIIYSKKYAVSSMQDKNKCKSSSLLFYCLLPTAYCLLFLLSSCATSPELPPPPPKYVYQEERALQPSKNSLWYETASLYEDMRARRLNDIVTILVDESIAGSGKADTNTDKDSSADYGISDLFGMNNDFNLHNVIGLKDMYKGANVFSPTIKGSGKSEFKGSGETNREGKLTGKITAKVVEVMPNGNLVLESRKEITINREKQILVLRGMIRPEDVNMDNTVLSSKVADAAIFFVGDGVIHDKQGPGWLVRVLDRVWPF